MVGDNPNGYIPGKTYNSEFLIIFFSCGYRLDCDPRVLCVVDREQCWYTERETSCFEGWVMINDFMIRYDRSEDVGNILLYSKGLMRVFDTCMLDYARISMPNVLCSALLCCVYVSRMI